jgi:hypothetical protein
MEIKSWDGNWTGNNAPIITRDQCDNTVTEKDLGTKDKKSPLFFSIALLSTCFSNATDTVFSATADMMPTKAIKTDNTLETFFKGRISHSRLLYLSRYNNL